MKVSHMRTVRLVLLPALMAASIFVPFHDPGALEATAVKKTEQAQTDLNTDMKVSAFSAAVQAAFNVFKSQVDTFNGRITTLESWKPGIDNAITNLTARVASLESQAASCRRRHASGAHRCRPLLPTHPALAGDQHFSSWSLLRKICEAR